MSSKQMFPPLFNNSPPETSPYKSKPLNAAPINWSVKVIVAPGQHVPASMATYKVLNGPQREALRSRHTVGTRWNLIHFLTYNEAITVANYRLPSKYKERQILFQDRNSKFFKSNACGQIKFDGVSCFSLIKWFLCLLCKLLCNCWLQNSDGSRQWMVWHLAAVALVQPEALKKIDFLLRVATVRTMSEMHFQTLCAKAKQKGG